jgi:hypothetical protein
MIPNCELKGLEEKGLEQIVNDEPDLPKAGALIQFDLMISWGTMGAL